MITLVLVFRQAIENCAGVFQFVKLYVTRLQSLYSFLFITKLRKPITTTTTKKHDRRANQQVSRGDKKNTHLSDNHREPLSVEKMELAFYNVLQKCSQETH